MISLSNDYFSANIETIEPFLFSEWTWMQLTCDQRLICHRMSLDDPPINWKLPSRDDFNHIASLHQLNIHLFLTETKIK